MRGSGPGLAKVDEGLLSMGSKDFKIADKVDFVKEKPSSSTPARTVSKSIVVVDRVSVEGVVGSM